MKSRYASMPDWLFKWLGITPTQDIICFRMHDHDYGNAGHKVLNFKRADTRAEADANLRHNLIHFDLAPWKAWLIWAGCRLFVAHKWRKS